MTTDTEAESTVKGWVEPEIDSELRVLIVDDEPTNLALLVEVLGNMYRVQAASNGIKALELAGAEPPPNLILLDVMMPDMDGHEVCRRLKADDKTRDIPVIFVTGHDDVEFETHGFALGAADYITKPIRPALVRARVHTHLALQQRNRSLEALVQARTAQIMESNRLLQVEIIEREQAMERIEHILGHDSLTRLPNRMRFLKTLAEAVTSAKMHSRALAVITISLEHFAAINKKHGQENGDLTLQELGLRVLAIAGAEQLCCRSGPTTFSVIVQGDNNGADALKQRVNSTLEQLSDSLAKPVELAECTIPVHFRAGFARFTDDERVDASTLLQIAESAAIRTT